MAIKKEVELNVNTQAGLRAMEELGVSFKDAFTEADNLSGEIGELEDALYDMARAGLQGTQEFEDLTQEIGAMKKIIIDTDLAVDGMSQTMAQNMGGALNGLAGGFALGTGAMGAFGVESEKVEEMLLRVQSAMAISQGIQSIREAIPSFKALGSVIAKTAIGQKALNVAQAAGAIGMKVLNAIMNLNPVFLMVTAFAALTAAIIYFARSTDKAAEKHERLNVAMERTERLIETTARKAREASEQRLKMLSLEVGKEKEAHEERLRLLKIEEKERVQSIDKELNGIKKLEELKQLALREGNADEAESINTQIKESAERYRELTAQNEKYNNDKEFENAQFAKQEKERIEQEKADNAAKYQTFIDNQRAYNQKRLEVAQEIEDRELALQFENEAKAQEANLINLERKRASIMADQTLEKDEKLKLIELAEREAWEKRKEISDIFNAQMQEAVKEGRAEEKDLELAIHTEHEQKKTDITTEFEKTRAEKMAEGMEKAQQASAQYVGATMQGLQAMDDLNTLITDQQVAKAQGNAAAEEAARKKGFERSKKLQLTMAVIQGVQGVMAAFTAGSSMGPAGVVMGPVMAALAAVTAGINIAKIAKTKYEGGASSGGASVPRAPSIPSPASFNVVGNDGNNQLAETLGEQPPITAQVVGSEVTTQQSLDRNKVENASL